MPFKGKPAAGQGSQALQAMPGTGSAAGVVVGAVLVAPEEMAARAVEEGMGAGVAGTDPKAGSHRRNPSDDSGRVRTRPPLGTPRNRGYHRIRRRWRRNSDHRAGRK